MDNEAWINLTKNNVDLFCLPYNKVTIWSTKSFYQSINGFDVYLERAKGTFHQGTKFQSGKIVGKSGLISTYS